MSVRDWYISEALQSFRRLKSVLEDLTEDEVEAALKLEHGSRRRATVVRLLTAKAAQFNRSTFTTTLKEKINGP